MQPMELKHCCDCGLTLSFEQFWQHYPSLSKERALSLWKDPLFSIYCPLCFFNRPEKPFKRKRRDAQWYRATYF